MNEHPFGLDPQRPILLVSDQSWNAQGGGAVILKSLFEHAIGRGIIWVTPGESIQDLPNGHYGLGVRQHDYFSNCFLKAGQLADRAVDLAKQTNACAFWLVMHGSTIVIGDKIARRSPLPVHLTVNDDPIYATALRSKKMIPLAPLMARALKRLMKRATTMDVTSANMGRRYLKKYGTPSVVLHRSHTEPVLPSPRYDLRTQGITVGVLGNVYNYKQLPVLAEAVIEAAAQHKVPGKIIVCGHGFGDRLKAEMAGRLEVEATQHLDEPRAIERLQGCLALYLNYPFGWRNHWLGENSFPTKLSTYVYAARPVIAHAPAGTSIEELSKDYSIPWQSMKAADGAKLLAELAGNPRHAESYHAEAEAVRQKYFLAATHQERLQKIFDKLTGKI